MTTGKGVVVGVLVVGGLGLTYYLLTKPSSTNTPITNSSNNYSQQDAPVLTQILSGVTSGLVTGFRTPVPSGTSTGNKSGTGGVNRITGEVHTVGSSDGARLF